jgi:hydroxymethylglutaryl-CoA lyase
MPQMADTAALVEFANTIPGLTVAVLVPNLFGAAKAIEAGVDLLSIPVSASETHSRLNVRRTHAQMIEEIRGIRAAVDALAPPRRPHFSANVATAFGCSIEGVVRTATVVDLAERMLDAGADEIGLSDTTGYADPNAVRERVRDVRSAIGAERLVGVHLHNTRGLGLANALAALDEGITTIDSSLAGLGGCPAAPGASGNIVTEDLAFMLAAMGYDTGIDLHKLFEVRKILAGGLPDEPLYGFATDAGLPLGFSVATRA